jgi:Rrf2 family protein
MAGPAGAVLSRYAPADTLAIPLPEIVPMPVTAKAEYACLAMLELAARYAEGRPVRLAEVTDKHGIHHGFLVQILVQLRNRGLVATTRGKAGGYQLAKPPGEITLADIVEVLDGLEEADTRNTTATAFSQRLQGVWAGLAKKMADTRTGYLNEFTLQDLLPTDAAHDYII